MKKCIAKILIIVLALYAAVQIKDKYIIVATVPTGSMEPTISAGNYVLGIRYDTEKKDLKRGDIVFFERNSQVYVKRIIGIPGDSLTIASGNTYINGNLITENYVKSNWDVTREIYSCDVPLHKYFVMGDNRLNSDDSRQWGCISDRDIFAKAKWIIIPFKKI